jgi:hypothetical protein
MFFVHSGTRDEGMWRKEVGANSGAQHAEVHTRRELLTMESCPYAASGGGTKKKDSMSVLSLCKQNDAYVSCR